MRSRALRRDSLSSPRSEAISTATAHSDGRASVLELGLAARALGYEYIAICDHTQAVRVVPGLDADAVRRQGEEIAAANEQLAPFQILRGSEVDILPDGSLDLPDEVLAELDWVQLSLHAGQREPRDRITKRVVEAMRHPSVSCLSHPKGRIVNHRPPNALDLDVVFEVAAETGVALETNGLPSRLDLTGAQVRQAIEAEPRSSPPQTPIRSLVSLTCNSRFHTARRGRATTADLVNTRPLSQLLSARKV